MTKKAKTTKKEPASNTDTQNKILKKRQASFYVRAGLLLLGSMLLIGGMVAWAFYRDHALPNVKVGSIVVGQHSHNEIKQAALNQQALLQVTFFDDKQQATTIPANNLGVTIDLEATAERAMQARNPMLWQTEHIPLVLITDPGVLRSYMQIHYPSLYVDAQDARLIYNVATKQFDVQPGIKGKGFDVAWFEAQLPDLALNPRALALRLQTAPIEPIITEQSLSSAQKKVNEQLKLPITFVTNDQPIYTATSDDISNLVQFIPEATKRTVTIEYDKAKAIQFLSQKVAPIIAKPPIDRKVIVDKQTGSQFVVSEGRSGQQIENIETIADDIIAALTQKQPLTKELSVVSAPFKTVMLEGSSHWLEIDLSEQRLTMYVDQAPIRSFLISSGKARTPTPTGTFRVYSKVTSQTMTGTFAGDYFYLPNVKWVNYIYGDVAIHGTYWHNNFGYPMSHGCINMTEAAAKIVYDFAPIGTRVVVHG